MDWRKWKIIYEEILKDFGYSREKDEKAARIAESMAKDIVGEKEIKKIIYGKVVSICGAALQEEEMEALKKDDSIIAADEATSILMSKNIIPHIITTDLDGNVQDIIKANKKGSIAIIHAHGDNICLIKKYLPKFEGKIMITTQSEPSGKVYNFGGFTDGDRAYCIAKHFHAGRINLLGFDFENVIEKEGKDSKVKKRKLKWAQKIIRLCDE